MGISKIILSSHKSLFHSLLKKYHTRSPYKVYCTGNLHNLRPEGCSFQTHLFESEVSQKQKVGKSALLLHDLPGNALDLESLSKKLSANNFSILGVNFPGSGYTIGSTPLDESVYSFSMTENADYVSAIYEALPQYKYDLLVGVGLGCYTACLLASCLFERFPNLCLIDPPDVSQPHTVPRFTDMISKPISSIVSILWSSNFILKSLVLNFIGLSLGHHKTYLNDLTRGEGMESDWRRLALVGIMAEARKDTPLIIDTCPKICFPLSLSSGSSQGSVTLIRSPGISNRNDSGSEILRHSLASFDSVTCDVNNQSDLLSIDKSKLLLVNLTDSKNLIRRHENRLLSYNDEHLASAIYQIMTKQTS